MSSERAMAAADTRLQRPYAWFDPEAAAVVTILLGLFQLVLCVPLIHTDQTLPKLFILPLVLGILIVAGGSLTIANERNPNRQLLQGCAYSNVAGLIVALLAFCLYCYSLNPNTSENHCKPSSETDYHYYMCPAQIMEAYRWSIVLLLLLYDIAAVVLHSLLSFSALKTLKTD
ncbi:uncharacterized protein si:dkey-9i23.16 [Anabas testudineus]|uniref:uncharacterized protein si:dkey-9i23.16 n=1 Tax=Anabas testudineus TaxID=64144 RepID=UPI00143D85CA|nr:uncharacterized protein si:dkey-9i23.16 [Anabas testudineus]